MYSWINQNHGYNAPKRLGSQCCSSSNAHRSTLLLLLLLMQSVESTFQLGLLRG
eukprot:COSAG01_NODE_58899_length_303_cov_0.892157_1_plen_53_part_10